MARFGTACRWLARACDGRGRLAATAIGAAMLLTVPSARVDDDLTLLFVVDGLRRDSIDPAITPTLFRLQREGVRFTNSHSVFPTLTQVNAAAISSGRHPANTGKWSNRLLLGEDGRQTVLNAADYEAVQAIADQERREILPVRTLADLVTAQGATFAAVTAVSSGASILLNPRASQGRTGLLASAGYGRPLVQPATLADALTAAAGAVEPWSNKREQYLNSVRWAGRVVREYVLPVMRARVVVNWYGEPDNAQHETGLSSPQSLAGLRAVDRELAAVIEEARRTNRTRRLDVMVISDHGHATSNCQVNVGRVLADAGLLTRDGVGQVGVLEDSQIVQLHVPGRDPAWVNAIVKRLQQQPDTGLVFTHRPSAREGSTEKKPAWEGWVDGTFALEFVHMAPPGAGPDIVASFRWSAEKNRYGVEGSTCTSDTRSVPDGVGSGHGGLDPYAVGNTMIGWGASFRRGVSTDLPASNIDIVPTLLATLGMTCPDCDGRVLDEALADRRRPAAAIRRTHVVTHGRYRASLSVSELNGHRYVDRGTRY